MLRQCDTPTHPARRHPDLTPSQVRARKRPISGQLASTRAKSVHASDQSAASYLPAQGLRRLENIRKDRLLTFLFDMLRQTGPKLQLMVVNDSPELINWIHTHTHTHTHTHGKTDKHFTLFHGRRNREPSWWDSKAINSSLWIRLANIRCFLCFVQRQEFRYLNVCLPD